MYNSLHNKNILFVCHDFLQAPQSSKSRQVRELANTISKRPGFTVDILCLPPTPGTKNLPGHNPQPEPRTIIINSRPRLFTFEAVRSRDVARETEELLSRSRYDVLHVFTLGELSAAPVEVARDYGLQVFITLCDFWFLCEENHDLGADNPVCTGPENEEKCVQCFLDRYISDQKRDDFKLPVKDHKKSRVHYLQKILKMSDGTDAQTLEIKEFHEVFALKGIELSAKYLNDNISSIAKYYIQKYTAKSPKKTSIRPEKRKRILFYFFDKMHLPILLPVYKKIKVSYPGYDFCFAAMPRGKFSNSGFSKADLEPLEDFQEQITFYPQELVPDVTILPDSYYPEGCGKFVHVGHGVLSKGIYYADSQQAREEEKADLVCVPGMYHQRILQKIISSSVMPTGMAKLDSLFQGRINKKTVCKAYGLPEDYTYILYAPTYNHELSSLEYLLEHIGRALIDKKHILLIKLHSQTKSRHKTIARELVQTDKRIIHVSSQDITEFLALADVMISDVSSAMMEFAALDKPLVLFNNPAWQDYKYYDPRDIDFAWRDIGLQITGSDQLKDAVQECLRFPDELSRIRTGYTDQLFANKYTGKAAESIAALVDELANSE